MVEQGQGQYQQALEDADAGAGPIQRTGCLELSSQGGHGQGDGDRHGPGDQQIGEQQEQRGRCTQVCKHRCQWRQATDEPQPHHHDGRAVQALVEHEQAKLPGGPASRCLGLGGIDRPVGEPQHHGRQGGVDAVVDTGDRPQGAQHKPGKGSMHQSMQCQTGTAYAAGLSIRYPAVRLQHEVAKQVRQQQGQ